MSLSIPNTPSSPTAEQSTQSGLDQRHIEALVAAWDETYVVTGCAVTSNSNMAPSVSAGMVVVGGAPAAVAAGTVTITTADATDPRIDLIVANSSGTKSVIAGTPAPAFDATHAGPVMPAIGSNVLLAWVYVAAATTTIATADISDGRIIISRPTFKVQVTGSAVTHTQSSTALESITGLLVPIPASSTGVWFYEQFMQCTAASATSDWKWGYSVTSGITMKWGPLSTSSTSPLNGWGMSGTAATVLGALTEGSTVSAGSLNGTVLYHIGGYIYSNNTGSATVQAQFAQNTSDASNNTIQLDSFMRVTRIRA